MAERSVSHKVLQALNFNGLVIELIAKTPEEEQNQCETVNSRVNKTDIRVDEAMIHVVNNQIGEAKKLKCEICFNVITPGDEVILESCLDIFCRSREFDLLSPKFSSSEISSEVDADESDDYMNMFKQYETLSRNLETTQSKSAVVENAKSTRRMMNSTSDQNFFIKQERGTVGETTTNLTRNDNNSTDYGAAGLWAQNLQHPSFVGTLSPDVKREQESPFRRQQQTSVIRSVLLTNNEEFVCSICEMFVIEEQGIVLKNCRHNFCRTCLIDAIDHNHTYQVLCPMSIEPCSVVISDEEVQALLTPQAYQKFIEKCTVYLTEREAERNRNTTTVPALLELENFDYVENRDKFDCAICLTEVNPGEGLVLKNCLHEFCKVCLARHIELSDELQIPCPFVAEHGAHCEGWLQDRELRSLITEAVYGTHLARSLVRAEAVIKDSFHCQTADCVGWAEAGQGATEFKCPVCSKTNCIKCKAIHEGRSCQDYFYEINEDERKLRDTGLTEVQVKEMLARKEAMLCPGCSVLIQRTTGCRHMTCSRCLRQFQWLGT